jgi:hypothetical protein
VERGDRDGVEDLMGRALARSSAPVAVGVSLCVRLGASLCVSLFAGCGDPLVGIDYHGEPLFEIEGLVKDYQSSTVERRQIRASLFWSLTGETTTQVADLIEQPFVSTEISFLVVFKINIFHPPPKVVTTGRMFATGMILVFDDADGDGVLDQDEIHGGADLNAVLYAPEEVPAEYSPTRQPLPKGYSIVTLPLACWSSTSPVESNVGAEECGVSLGAGCATDADCGKEGLCLLEQEYFSESFPNGYCVMGYVEGGCKPRGGILEPPIEVGPNEFLPPDYWLQSCKKHEDCRVGEGYRCDFAIGACWPEYPAEIVIIPQFEVAPLCL